MDLHFCSRCGISIPQSEIDSGSADGGAGKYFCSEHRGGVAVADAPAAAVPGAPEPELLFCANCRVSIPLGDVKSGRAHREFGSLLCAGCSKADPGERAARREAVEAEMAADVDSQDPIVARRCSVCSAVVPYGQIVTGKARVEGNQVVCERCRAAAGAPSEARAGGGTSPVLVVLLVAAAGAIGFFGVRAFQESRAEKKDAPDYAARIDGLRSDVNALLLPLNERLGELDERLAGAERAAAAPGEWAAQERARVDAEIESVRRLVADARADLARGELELKERIAKLEGTVAGLSEMVRTLAARAPERAPETANVPQPETPTAPTKTEPPPVNPAVSKHCRDLLDPGAEDGVRYAAATELSKLKDPASIPSLVKALQDDKHYFVRRACARGLGEIRAWLAVPALIKTLEDKEPYVALAANQALQTITGVDFGVNQDTPQGQRRSKAQAAEKWWDKNKDKPPEGVSTHPVTD